jgi:hypothetical protein
MKIGKIDSRTPVLELNQKLRNERLTGGVAAPGGDIGYVALNIPVGDMRVLQIRFPDLMSLDAEIQHKAWQKFIASPASAPYKLRRNDGKKGLRNSHGIIVK